jgi:ATP-dependent exoDNAse (exonuclease V) beta subunit
VNKGEKLEQWRRQWKGHKGCLPEDVLLRGQTALDWVMPAIACGGVTAGWDGRVEADKQVVVRIYEPGAAARTPAPEEADAARQERVRRILAGEPLKKMEGKAQDTRADESVKRLRTRITGKYAQEALTKSPAVRTVTFLKALQGEEEREVIPMDGMEAIAEAEGAVEGDGRAAEEAKLRGIATHRMLELLNFAAVAEGKSPELQMGEMVHARTLLKEEAERADMAGIQWFLEKSTVGKRLIAAARKEITGHGVQIRRELAFTWAAPVGNEGSSDPHDWPTIRGVIDVLVTDQEQRAAEIIDYKTDSLRMWERRLPEYERQMTYYLRAASEILGFEVERAVLVFLTAREEREVTIHQPRMHSDSRG